MAIIVYSPIISDASGKVGDVVFSKWKGRALVRRRVVPANPDTAAQQAVRNAMALLVACWKSMDTDLKAAWTRLAAAARYSTFNAFTSGNMTSEIAGDFETLTPANADVNGVATLSAATGVGGGEIDLTWTVGSATGTDPIVVAARLQDAGALTIPTITTETIADTTYTITGLEEGEVYCCYLAADGGDDGYSITLMDTATSGTT